MRPSLIVPVVAACALSVSCTKGSSPVSPSGSTSPASGPTSPIPGPTSPDEAPTPLPGRIAFSSTRDGAPALYVAEGLEVRPLTRGDYPSWSRDGRIAFERDGQILVINADGGGERPLGAGIQPDWSPDGTKIAFVRVESAADNRYSVSLYVMNADGSAVTRLVDSSRLTPPGGMYIQTPSWAPDGRRIAFTYTLADGESPALYLADADGTNVRLFGNPYEPRYSPSWAPDGSRIAVVGHGASKIDLAHVDGSGHTEAVGDRHIVNGQKTPDNTLFFHPDWTRDGRLVYGRSVGSGRNSSIQIRLFVGGDGTEHPILAEAATGRVYSDLNVAIEP